MFDFIIPVFRAVVVLFVLFIFNHTQAQEKFTLNGYVKDAANGEELIGVTVYVDEIKNGVISNPYGFYALSLPLGNYTISYSFIGYKTIVKTLALSENETLNIELSENVYEVEGVTVEGEAIDANVTDMKMSRNELNIKQIKRLPALFGEPDIIKTIQMLPGVLTAGEGTSSFYVRGGSADQNLILIDEAPVYDPSHLFGLFSVFNADVIKGSELYKGGIPSKFGGRLSSILEVRTKDGNNKKVEGSAGIGTLASKVMIEGPLKKDKSSFIISGRRSYVDIFLKAAGKKSLVYFYDVNAKVNWKYNNNNRFFVSLYAGRDDFSFDDSFGFNWGNKTATFRWNHLFNDRLFSNTSLIASIFDYGLKIEDPAQGFKWVSNLQEYSFKEDLSYFLNPSNEMTFGYHFTYRRFSPGEITPSEESVFASVALQKEFALDHAFYLDNEQKVSNRLSLKYGVRLSVFQSVGEQEVYTYEDRNDNIIINRTDTLYFGKGDEIETYVNFEPRFSTRYMLNSTSSIKASYNRMVQNTHLISSGTVPLPFNTWSPSSYYLPPQFADQITLGYFRNLKENAYEFSAEVYYKKMDNLAEFADNAQIFFNDDLPTEFRQGESDAYGLELFVQKKEGLLTGFVSYTLSNAERTVPDVNQGYTFPANYDRRHSLNVVATYEYDGKWTFGAGFTYSTGRPITVPSATYEFAEGYLADYFSERNGYRLPDFHRLDMSATLTPRKNEGRKWKTSWSFSIYNVYNRKNIFTIYTKVKEDENGDITGDGRGKREKEIRKISLFPILPSITYNIRF